MYEVFSDIQRDGLQILLDLCLLPFYSQLCDPGLNSIFGSIKNHVSVTLNHGNVLFLNDFPKRACVRCTLTCAHSDLLASQNSSWVKINIKLAGANNIRNLDLLVYIQYIHTNVPDTNTTILILF